MSKAPRKKVFTFDVYFLGDLAAGLRSFSETIAVTLDSGDPGGAPGEFEQFIADALSEWYDGATVTVKTLEGGCDAKTA